MGQASCFWWRISIDWSSAGGPIQQRRTLHGALRSDLGDEAFWAGLRAYTRAHAGGTVTSIDLERAMEKASGRDLSDTFAEMGFRK